MKRPRIPLLVATFLALAGVALIFCTYVWFDGAPLPLFVGLGLIGLAFASAALSAAKRVPARSAGGAAASPQGEDETYWFFRHRTRIFAASTIFAGGTIALGLIWSPARPLVPMFLILGVVNAVTFVAHTRMFERGSHRRRPGTSRRERIAWIVALLILGIGALSYLVVIGFRSGSEPPPVAVGSHTLKPLTLRLSDLPSRWEADRGWSLTEATRAYRGYARCYDAPPPLSFAVSPVYALARSGRDALFAYSSIALYRSPADALLRVPPVPADVEACLRDVQVGFTPGLYVVSRVRLTGQPFAGNRTTFRYGGRVFIEDLLLVRLGRVIVSVRFSTYASDLPTDVEVHAVRTLMTRVEATARML